MTGALRGDRPPELATRASGLLRAFNRAGVALDDADQERLRAMNTRLAMRQSST